MLWLLLGMEMRMQGEALLLIFLELSLLVPAQSKIEEPTSPICAVVNLFAPGLCITSARAGTANEVSFTFSAHCSTLQHFFLDYHLEGYFYGMYKSPATLQMILDIPIPGQACLHVAGIVENLL